MLYRIMEVALWLSIEGVKQRDIGRGIGFYV